MLFAGNADERRMSDLRGRRGAMGAQDEETIFEYDRKEGHQGGTLLIIDLRYKLFQ